MKIKHFNAWILWCKRRGCRGWKHSPKTFDLVKIQAKPVEMWANFVNTLTKSLYVLWFYKSVSRNQSADFIWRSYFYTVLFVQDRLNLVKLGENLGKFGENFGKCGGWSALIGRNAPNVKRNALVFCFVFGGHFLWSIFGHVWGNLCINLTHPQNFACAYTYAWNNHRFWSRPNVCWSEAWPSAVTHP